MSKGWIVGIIAGIVGIIAFFIPAYMITLSMEYMGNIINLFMTTWYWGFYMYSISGTISGSATGIQILTFMFIVGIVGIILSIIMIILGALSRSESKIPVLWIIFGIILIVLPLTELIFEYFGGSFQIGSLTIPATVNMLIIPIAPIVFVISGILAIIGGIKAR